MSDCPFVGCDVPASAREVICPRCRDAAEVERLRRLIGEDGPAAIGPGVYEVEEPDTLDRRCYIAVIVICAVACVLFWWPVVAWFGQAH